MVFSRHCLSARTGFTLLLFVQLCLVSLRAADQKLLNASLLEAVERGDVAEARKLLAEGASPLVENSKGWPPLVLAVKAPNLDLVKLLVENGADVNARGSATNGSTVFSFAAEGGSFEVMDYLLEKGADINGKGKDGLLPLVYVATRGRTQIVKYLLSKGADPEEFGPSDSKGIPFNALLAAARNHHIETFKVLIESRTIDLERTNSKGETLLMSCARKSPHEIIKLLLKKGANVHATGPHGHTALIFASYNGQLETVKTLLAYGADPFATATDDPDPKSERRYDSARLAREQRHPEVYELIIEAQKKPRVRASSGLNQVPGCAARRFTAPSFQTANPKRSQATALHIALRLNRSTIERVGC
jgi:ankyrin repeat protein